MLQSFPIFHIRLNRSPSGLYLVRSELDSARRRLNHCDNAACRCASLFTLNQAEGL
jgi:hypothetical protein